jgi:hypothetical protein
VVTGAGAPRASRGRGSGPWATPSATRRRWARPTSPGRTGPPRQTFRFRHPRPRRTDRRACATLTASGSFPPAAPRSRDIMPTMKWSCCDLNRYKSHGYDTACGQSSHDKATKTRNRLGNKVRRMLQIGPVGLLWTEQRSLVVTGYAPGPTRMGVGRCSLTGSGYGLGPSAGPPVDTVASVGLSRTLHSGTPPCRPHPELAPPCSVILSRRRRIPAAVRRSDPRQRSFASLRMTTGRARRRGRGQLGGVPLCRVRLRPTDATYQDHGRADAGAETATSVRGPGATYSGRTDALTTLGREELTGSGGTQTPAVLDTCLPGHSAWSENAPKGPVSSPVAPRRGMPN